MDDQALCGRCYTPPTATCVRCGAERPCLYIDAGTPTCDACRHKLRPRETCSGCGREHYVSYRTPDGRGWCTLCGAKRRPCASCGKTVRINTRAPDGAGLCTTCWRSHPASKRACRACGEVTHLVAAGRCAPCAAHHQLHELLSTHSRVRPDVQPVLDALLRRDPQAMISWLSRRPQRATLLRALAAGHGPVGHQTLDQLGPAKIVNNLRTILMAGGALPPRDERLAALQRWIPTALARVQEAEARRVLHSFTTWHLMRRLRACSKRRPLTSMQVHQARAQVRHTVRLLNWLAEQGATLRACTQDHIDAWLDQRQTHTHVYTFVGWASTRGHTQLLRVPLPVPIIKADLLAADARWALVNRLLHDRGLSVRDRTAALLVLLFAQPLTRIVTLTTRDIRLDGPNLALQLGNVPAQMPPPLDAYLRELHDQAVQTGAPPEVRWLFPGRFPGQHISSDYLSHHLRKLGFPARIARSTALIELAGELPAVVVSRLLGLCQTTADTWQRIAAADDAVYATVLVHRQRGRRTP
ncbi:hypothetical protein [Streptomyces cavernicola]|uniref:Site-specific integrase n=1 Tax=Streptomyces cavernicola TaxID=3043613 RepID=A0ABT6SNX7_9ACTN|nr:hypothetical protein [Streptomyces sp. B-S-A6]MDI3408941.1 hypothetical protein [Streptomyces sp. B-S-A6]